MTLEQEAAAIEAAAMVIHTDICAVPCAPKGHQAGIGVTLLAKKIVAAVAEHLDGAEANGPGCDLPPGGQFMRISFLGHDEVTGYVTDVTVGGEPGFHIDKPGKLWGGNPNAWEEWAGKALRMREPLTEQSVRAEWEARRAAEERRRQQQAEWERQQAQRALPAGEDDGPWAGEDEAPGFDHMRGPF